MFRWLVVRLGYVQEAGVHAGGRGRLIHIKGEVGVFEVGGEWAEAP